MKNIRGTIERAMREGLTVNEVCQIAHIIAGHLTEEQEKEEKVAEARLKAAEALSDYANMVAGREIATVEEAFELLENNEDVVCELFENADNIAITTSTPSESEDNTIEVRALEPRDLEALRDDFSEFLKRLGY